MFCFFLLIYLIRLNTVTTLAEECDNANIFGKNFVKVENKNIGSCIFIPDLLYKLNIFK